MVPEDKRVGRKLADDAMFRLEHESGDKGKADQEDGPRLGRIFFSFFLFFFFFLF